MSLSRLPATLRFVIIRFVIIRLAGARRGGALAVAALSLFLGGAPPPAAAQSLRPGVIGQDDRRIVERGAPLWDAVGQVNIGGYNRRGQCTGTLVAPDLVITAAHCLVDPRRGAPFPLRDIHFVAGADRGARVGHATAACLRFLDGNPMLAPDVAPSPALRFTLAAAAKDAAAIVLTEPLSIPPAPLAISAAPPPSLTHAAYFGDRRHVLSAHRDCRVLSADPETTLWKTDCDAHFASSGGPIFAESAKGELSLAAIMIAIAPRQGASLALPVSTWRALTEGARCP